METAVASTKDLAPGKVIGVEKDGNKILVANLNGKYYAIGNSCTHMRCKLSSGTISGESIQCPCHGSTFDLKTGAVVKGPAKNPEPSYQVRIDGDQILVTV